MFYVKVTSVADEGKMFFYLDFSKGFDIITHSILLEKLSAHGLGRCSVCWVQNCLNG